MFRFSLQILSEIFLILRRIKRNIIIDVQKTSSKETVIILRLQWKSNFLYRFSTNAQISNFIKIRPVEAELFHADGQADMKKLIVAFRNIANSPKN
jgi:hypothetical protein